MPYRRLTKKNKRCKSCKNCEEQMLSAHTKCASRPRFASVLRSLRREHVGRMFPMKKMFGGWRTTSKSKSRSKSNTRTK